MTTAKQVQTPAEESAAVKYAMTVRADLIESLGGQANLSPQQVIVIDRIAFIDANLRNAEHRFLTRRKLCTSEYTQLVHALTSLLKQVGMKRLTRTVPTALEYAWQAAQPQEPVEP